MFWENKNRKQYFLVYTVLFFFMFFVCYELWFRLANTSYIWSFDGVEQQYTNFVYIGQWIRSIIKGILSGHFHIPMWDMSIGYGSDIFISLGGSLFDPFHWLSALVPSVYTEIAFELMVVAKIYLCGLTFSLFCLYNNKSFISTLIGSLCYTFSAPMFIAFKQETFIFVFYLFPLIMLGFEKIWNKEKPYLFIITLTVTLLHSFYFTYMIVIMIVVYFIIKSISQRDHTFKDILKLCSYYIIAGIVGFGMGIGLLLPVISNLMGTERLSIDYYIPLLFDKAYVGNVLYGFITEWETGNDALIGFPILSVMCIIILFLSKKTKDYLDIKIMVIIGTVAFFIPYVGSVFNGMSYITTRWVFGYLFLISWITVIVVDHTYKLGKVKTIITSVITLLYGALVIIVFNKYNERILLVLILSVLIAFFWLISAILKPIAYYYIILGLACLALFLPCAYRFSPRYDFFPYRQQLDRGNVYQRLMDSGAKPLVYDTDKTVLTRYDERNINRWRNSSMLVGISGMDMYNSFYNNNIDIYYKHLAVGSSPIAFSYYGLNSRSNLERLNGVNSFLINSGDYNALPYGFDKLAEKQNIRGVNYEEWLPSDNNDIAYSFDQIIRSSEYEKMSPYQREKALMLGVVLDESPFEEAGTVIGEASLSAIDIAEDIVNYEFESIDGVTVQDNKISVEHDQSSFTIRIDPVKDSEVYVYFENLNSIGGIPSYYGVNIYAYNDESENVIIKSGFSAYSSRYFLYGGKHNWLQNLGFTKDRVDRIVVTFTRAGEYSFDALKVYVKPADMIETLNNSLKTCLSSARIDCNTITLDADLSQESYLFISVPYSKGWKATIDGMEKKILKADDAFMCIRADVDGKRIVQLKYETPYLSIGVIITIAFIVLFITGIIIDHIIVQKKTNINKH